MKSSKALKKALKLIEAGKEKFVCCALEAVKGKRTAVYKDITWLIYPHGTVTGWLYETCEAYRAIVDQPELDNQRRLYRIRWVNHMIKQYKAKGD
jgi:hypothetical protein